MFQTRDIKNPGTTETLVVTENTEKWQSDERDTCMDKEDNPDQDESSPPSETDTPAEITDTEAVETHFKDLTNKTEYNDEEENLDDIRKCVSIEPTEEEALYEENRTKAVNMKQSKEKKFTAKETRPKGKSLSIQKIPGSWRKGDVPSSTLTEPEFSQTDKNKVSAQKYPCFVPKCSKKVIILRHI